tara:strand:+ start:163 stop:504 length:342 start_codon:yes stop_codon:yes gene_type:complete
MKQIYIDEAADIATKSMMKIATHGAIVIYRGKIVGRGYNKITIENVNKPNQFSVHAEVDAINNALRTISPENLRKSILIVVRVNKQHDIVPSSPCKCCRNFIIQKGLKCAYYS